MLCDLLYRIKLNSSLIMPDFAVLTLRTKSARNHFIMNSKGSSDTMQKINHEIIRSLVIPMPNIDVQKNIITKIEKKKSEVIKACELINSSIEILKEYRSAIITYAMTGKKVLDANNI